MRGNGEGVTSGLLGYGVGVTEGVGETETSVECDGRGEAGTMVETEDADGEAFGTDTGVQAHSNATKANNPTRFNLSPSVSTRFA